jgi:hypothetical protein
MCLSPTPDAWNWLSRQASLIHDLPREQFAQVEAAVEAIGERGQAAFGVLGPGQRVEGAVQRGLEFAQACVEPLELRQVTRLAIADHDGRVRAAGGLYRREAAQAVAEDRRSWRQVSHGPALDCLVGEATDAVEFDELRPPLVVERHGSYKRRLVLRTAPGLAARVLATQVGVIELDRARQPVLALAQRHGVVDLVLQRPSGGVAHAELALERQGRQPRLGLAEQVDHQEPCAQRQLGVLKQAAHGQRCLVTAGLALEQLTSAVANDLVFSCVAAQTTKSAGPASDLDGLGTLLLGAEALYELWYRHAVLELNGVEGHDGCS